MNAVDLERVFISNGVPHAYYSFRGPAAGDCYVFEASQSGWKTYYSERGSKYDEQTYRSEEEACNAMFLLIAKMVANSQHRQISALGMPDI